MKGIAGTRSAQPLELGWRAVLVALEAGSATAGA